MSKIGKKPIEIPEKVEVKINGAFLEFKGEKGTISIKLLPFIKTEIKDKTIFFSPENDLKQTLANWGTIRSLAANAIIGLIDGFEKVLEIEGVGYRANMEGETLVLNLGLSHPIKFTSPENIKILTEKNLIKISGIQKDLVGQTAAKIRAFKKPEPYKGKGIRYQGEVVRRKSGKKVGGAEK
ncbi:50S ribosomal protein L6 [Candidatus Wolfebacteria bacterium]|nr:50S ribosomal protein L6 [Candidatus Wolfebacteria bacterium]